MSVTSMHTGGCLCGAISYKISGDMREIVACHCSQCQKTSGNFVAATRVALNNLDITEANALQWYQSSPSAKRGFCKNCGSNLFWQSDLNNMSIFAGTIDQPSHLQLAKHIFVEEKADYYDLTDNLPKFAQSDL